MTYNLTFRAAAEILGLAISALSMVYLSRIVGPEIVGLSAVTSSLLLFLSRLADGGLTSLATQRLARDDARLDALLAITMPPKLVASAALVAVSVLVAGRLPIDPRLKYFISISIFATCLDACTPAWVFVAMGRIKILSMTRITQSLLAATAVFIFIHEPADWIYLPYLTLVNSLGSVGLSVFCLYRSGLCHFNGGLFDKDYLKTLRTSYREAFHFLKADLSVYIYLSSDRIFLYYFSNPYTVGLYEAAYKIIYPFYRISDVVTPTMFRSLAQGFKQKQLHKVMSVYVFAMAFLTIPLGFFLFYFSDRIISLLYGPRFSESVPCLMILGFVITFGFMSGIIVIPFSAWNMSREYGNSILSGNIANLALNFALIPMYGAIGAALATLGAKLIVTAVGLTYFRRVTDYPIVRSLSSFVLASIIPLLLVLICSVFVSNDNLNLVIYGSAYFLLIAGMYLHRFQLVGKFTDPEILAR